MLDRCDAICISPPNVPSLGQLALRAGFRSVADIAGGGHPAGPVVFYLVDSRVSDPVKMQIVRRLRGSMSADIRYAPIVLIAHKATELAVVKYAQWGFDDLIALPQTTGAVTQRLESQLLSERVYFETSTYFGPDRRRQGRAVPRPAGATPSFYFEHYFSRDPEQGIKLRRRNLQSTGGVAGLMQTLEHLQHAHR